MVIYCVFNVLKFCVIKVKFMIWNLCKIFIMILFEGVIGLIGGSENFNNVVLLCIIISFFDIMIKIGFRKWK